MLVQNTSWTNWEKLFLIIYNFNTCARAGRMRKSPLPALTMATSHIYFVCRRQNKCFLYSPHLPTTLIIEFPKLDEDSRLLTTQDHHSLLECSATGLHVTYIGWTPYITSCASLHSQNVTSHKIQSMFFSFISQSHTSELVANWKHHLGCAAFLGTLSISLIWDRASEFWPGHTWSCHEHR